MDFDDGDDLGPFIASANDCCSLNEVTLGPELLSHDLPYCADDQEEQTLYQDFVAALGADDAFGGTNEQYRMQDGNNNSFPASPSNWCSGRPNFTKKKATVLIFC